MKNTSFNIDNMQKVSLKDISFVNMSLDNEFPLMNIKDTEFV
jgi:hypothetical protein